VADFKFSRPNECAPTGLGRSHVGRRPNRAWAELMERSFGFEVLAWVRCAGRMTLVALIRDAAVVGRTCGWVSRILAAAAPQSKFGGCGALGYTPPRHCGGDIRLT